ncbi:MULTISPECIES: HAD family phosphatase [unclassified Photobacterium]|uniref:HAD family hydrolase n=1 Tax=unclassified Photobacterium TaxID=2628852 RepID=UPI000D155F3F|nr:MULTISPECIES: HAD family phosphatase [unclassified Photobacterium]PSV40142.1 HAD family phosphatase [Photobacterium sp. GB-210]PSV51855.1 HAD family phosphatase [Photobacterium sp. GB-1]
MQTIFFDFDGTLVDSERFHAVNWSQYLASYGVELNSETFMSQYAGVTWPQIAEHFIYQYNIPLTETVMIEEMEALTEKMIVEKGIPPMPGVDELLKTLSGKVPMAVVTGAPKDYVQGVLAQHGWLALFEHVFSGYEVANNKPAPDVYLQACKTMRVLPEKAVAVEDSRTGLMSALNANTYAVFVNSHNIELTAQAQHSFTSMKEATPALLSLLKVND